MEEQLIQLCKELGLEHIGVIESKNIMFRREFREICEGNQCGQYGQNWCCPPAIGEIEKAIERLEFYEKGIVIQTIQILEDCFDFEGMIEGKKVHKEKFLKLLENIKKRWPYVQLLPLSVGGCNECKDCSYLDGKPCRKPERAIPGMEGYGIDVLQMTKLANLRYNNGNQTVSYISFIGWN